MSVLLIMLLGTCTLLVGWVLWRLCSRRALLPCPSEFSWLVELENPVARATRSTRVLSHLAPAVGWRVLDLGCGPGRVSLPLAKALGPAGELLALDLQQEMLDKVAAKVAGAGLTNLRCVCSKAEAGLFSTASLDAVVMVMSLGEIPRDQNILSVVREWLKPGGRLLVAESVFDPHFIRRPVLRALAERAGFREASQDGNAFGYSLVFVKE